MMLNRREIAFITAITIGIIVGRFIKKATIGLLIGLALGLLAASLMTGQNKSKNDDRR
jgi:uncharacterized membrane-anchored protein YhcB (DUF1043 family)